MKLVMLLVTVSWLPFMSCGQEIAAHKVPSVVQNIIKAKFATASNVEWEKKNNLYEADFSINNVEYSAHIDTSGKIVLYKIEIPLSELPDPVTTAIARDNPGYKIDEAEKLEKDGLIYYLVELESSKKKDKKLTFLPDGNIVENFTYIK